MNTFTNVYVLQYCYWRSVYTVYMLISINDQHMFQVLYSSGLLQSPLVSWSSPRCSWVELGRGGGLPYWSDVILHYYLSSLFFGFGIWDCKAWFKIWTLSHKFFQSGPSRSAAEGWVIRVKHQYSAANTHTQLDWSTYVGEASSTDSQILNKTKKQWKYTIKMKWHNPN